MKALIGLKKFSELKKNGVMNKPIRIGTRDSQLALWQANTVAGKLNDLGYPTEIIAVKSTGDIVLDKPLYELGITGIFTKTLDVAMLQGEVDIAVHSMKDVPTALPKGIVQAAVLARANTADWMVTLSDVDWTQPCTIATGSLRRKAQWLNKYPHHTVVDLRGNVQTRMQKLQDNGWQGAIFAAAGLERLEAVPANYQPMDWMVPAPAQGAMVVVAMETDTYAREALAQLNHPATEIATWVEREFLRTLEGGCTAPIGAKAVVNQDQLEFTGVVFSLDGTRKAEIQGTVALAEAQQAGSRWAKQVLADGGQSIMEEIRQQLAK